MASSTGFSLVPVHVYGLLADFGTRDTKASGPGSPEPENRRKSRGAHGSSFRRFHDRSASLGEPRPKGLLRGEETLLGLGYFMEPSRGLL